MGAERYFDTVEARPIAKCRGAVYFDMPRIGKDWAVGHLARDFLRKAIASSFAKGLAEECARTPRSSMQLWRILAALAAFSVRWGTFQELAAMVCTVWYPPVSVWHETEGYFLFSWRCKAEGSIQMTLAPFWRQARVKFVDYLSMLCGIMFVLSKFCLLSSLSWKSCEMSRLSSMTLILIHSLVQYSVLLSAA